MTITAPTEATTEGVDWRGGCGRCVDGWALTVHGDQDVTYEECPCSAPAIEDPFTGDPDWSADGAA